MKKEKHSEKNYFSENGTFWHQALKTYASGENLKSLKNTEVLKHYRFNKLLSFKSNKIL